jgi:CBS domain-containing protein
MDDEVTRQLKQEGLALLLGTVGEAMTKEVVTLRPDTRTSDAVAILRQHGVGGAPVVEAGRMIGVATVSDLVALAPRAQATGPFLRPLRGRPDWCVRDVMTQSVIVAASDEFLVDAVVRMDHSRVDRLPVVDREARPVGILTREDVVHALARAVQHGRPHSDERRAVLIPD